MDLPNRPIRDPYREIPVKDFSYINTQKSLPKKSNYHLGLILVGLVVLVALGVGAYFYGHYTKTKTQSTKSADHKTSVAKKKSTTAAPKIPMTTYSSSSFNLTVNYPTSWTASAVGSNSLSFSSPEMKLIADSGASVEGEIVVNVYAQGQIPAAFGSTSVAVLNSQLITFSEPTSSQASQTYISFIQYPATTILGGLDGIYITGNDGYLKDQNIPSSDIDQVDPLIFVGFERCNNLTCTSQAPLTISSKMWNNLDFQTPILDILESFAFL